MSREHPAQYNETSKKKDRNFMWTEAEYEYLAETIRDLKSKKIRNVNKVAAEKLGRTEQGIVKIRTKTSCKQAEIRLREKISTKEINQTKDWTESSNTEKSILTTTETISMNASAKSPVTATRKASAKNFKYICITHVNTYYNKI